MDKAVELFNKSKEKFNSIEFYKDMSKEEAIKALQILQSMEIDFKRIWTITVINYDLLGKK